MLSINEGLYFDAAQDANDIVQVIRGEEEYAMQTKIIPAAKDAVQKAMLVARLREALPSRLSVLL